jgi:hypothetical protein
LSIINYPLVSVVVLNFRSPRDTLNCTQALLKQTIAEQMEILITDNKSEDESIGLIRAQFGNEPKVHIIEQRENLGYGRGNNAAARFAHGEYILILNPDNTLPINALEQMLQYLQAHDDVGIVGPALFHPDGSIRPSARRFPTILDLLRKRLSPEKWQEAYTREREEQDKQGAVEVDWLVGACLLMRTEFFRKLRGFDERFFLFFEDIDLCRRTKALGKKVVYLPCVRVLDQKARLSGNNLFAIFTKKTTRIHAASAVKYFWKWRGAKWLNG